MMEDPADAAHPAASAIDGPSPPGEGGAVPMPSPHRRPPPQNLAMVYGKCNHINRTSNVNIYTHAFIIHGYGMGCTRREGPFTNHRQIRPIGKTRFFF